MQIIQTGVVAGINPIWMMDRIYSKRYRQVQYMGNKQQNGIHFQKMQMRIDQGKIKEKMIPVKALQSYLIRKMLQGSFFFFLLDLNLPFYLCVCHFSPSGKLSITSLNDPGIFHSFAFYKYDFLWTTASYFYFCF